MTEASFHRIDLAEQQSAFTSLLAHPLVTPWTFPTVFTLVNRHKARIEQWCRRLGYRFIRIDQSYRLRRVPIAGEVAQPRGVFPRRRTLVLALLAAAILEDQRQDSITLQEISDDFHRFSEVNQFQTYDPEQRRHRLDLVEALRFLVSLGVVEQRTTRADLIGDWEKERKGIGAGYVIHRDALVLLVDAGDLDLALSPTHAEETEVRGMSLLRKLIETQSLEIDSLTPEEASYLVSQGHRLVAQASEMTGGTVEIRQDGWTLVLPCDQGFDVDLLVTFPEATAADWVALALLDAACQRATPHEPGRRWVSSADITAIAQQIHADEGKRLTIALRESPMALREAAERQLLAAGLIDMSSEGDWVMLPIAGRYREARLEGPPQRDEALTLFEEQT